MSSNWQEIARATLDASESGEMSFPECVRLLTQAGFDGYAVDFRRSTRTYYMPQGDAIELEAEPTPTPVAERFDPSVIQDAIREAQALVAGYSYRGFCAKVAAAGCAGYLVSLVGERVLYYGRTGETHTEHFPGARPAAGA
jgi:uncharacterized protein YbcV (DUF1398 family)